MAGPYIPTKDALLSGWLTNFSGLITAAPATYGLSPADATTIATVTASFTSAYATATNPSTRTAATVAAKNAAKAAALGVVRPYAQQIKNNGGVSNDDKVALGLNIDDPSRSPVPIPTTNPILSLVAATPLQHTLRFADALTPASRKKPDKVKFLFVFRKIGVARDPSPEGALFLNAITTQPFASDFSADDIGKVATYYAVWANNRGQRGPWSAPVSLTVV